MWNRTSNQNQFRNLYYSLLELSHTTGFDLEPNIDPEHAIKFGSA